MSENAADFTDLIEILYEDEYLIAVNKPSGLLVHPSWITARSEPHLMGLLKRITGFSKLHTLHRLDRATSGVILIGKELVAAQKVQSQFQNRQTSKIYHCLVRGWLAGAQRIDYPLKPKADRFAEPFARLDAEAKDAVTLVRPLAQIELDIPIGRYPKARYSWVEARPETGRKHQIRRHLKHLLHPIVGDTKYGEGRHNRLFREVFEIHRLLLHASALELEHPISGEPLKITAPLPSEIRSLLSKIPFVDRPQE